MSKKLLLVRHAKSDWNNLNLADFDRPLNERGQKNAPEMAKRLMKNGIIPELLVSSPALRALTTAELFAQELQYERSEIVRVPGIYEARTATLLGIINNFDNRYNFVALFGHNPGISHLAGYLSDANFHEMPTCGMVLIKFPFDDWGLVSADTGEVKLYDYPKKGHH